MQRCKAAAQAPRILPPRADEPHRRNNRSHYGIQRDLSATQSNLVETNHRPRISPAVRNTPTEIPYPPPERPKPAVNDESCALLCLPTPNAVPRRWQRCTPAAPPCRKEVAALLSAIVSRQPTQNHQNKHVFAFGFAMIQLGGAASSRITASRIHLGASALPYTCPQIMAASIWRFDFSQPGAYLRMCGLGPIASPIDYNLKPVQTKRSGNPKVGTPGPMTSPSRCEALHTSTIRRLPASIRAPATVTARRRSTRVSSARLGAGVRPRCGREGSAHHQTWRQGKRSVHAAVVWLSAPVRRI